MGVDFIDLSLFFVVETMAFSGSWWLFPIGIFFRDFNFTFISFFFWGVSPPLSLIKI